MESTVAEMQPREPFRCLLLLCTSPLLPSLNNSGLKPLEAAEQGAGGVVGKPQCLGGAEEPLEKEDEASMHLGGGGDGEGCPGKKVRA